MQFFQKLFSADFMPHGHCYFWRPEIVWMHVISDVVTGVAYYSIPLMLVYFIRKRRDVPFHWLFGLFAAFIFWCGTTHFMDVLTLWVPVYRLDGLVRVVTAAISGFVAVLLVRVIPQALAFKGPETLAQVNEALSNEIAEHRRMEETLRASEEKFRLLVTGVQNYAIYLLDVNGVVSSWNEGAERIKGYSATEVIGRPVSLFYQPSPDLEARLRRGFDSAIVLGRYEEEGLQVRKDGTTFLAHDLITPLYDSHHKLQGFCKIARDITEERAKDLALKRATDDLEDRVRERTEDLVRANEALFRSNAELQQFAYIASHDLQEPLRTITVYLQLLEDQCREKLDASEKETIRFAVEAASRMNQLIDSLLTYSRFNRKVDDVKPVDLRSVLSAAVGNLEAPIKETGAVITHGDLPTITASETQLVQLFQNLLGNALKFHGNKRPEIDVTAEQLDESGWRFRVHDNGIGIASQYQDKIFVLFKRLHKRDEYPGTGVGLAVCKKIVEYYGGKIWVESELGQGSSFFFTLRPLTQ